MDGCARLANLPGRSQRLGIKRGRGSARGKGGRKRKGKRNREIKRRCNVRGDGGGGQLLPVVIRPKPGHQPAPCRVVSRVPGARCPRPDAQGGQSISYRGLKAGRGLGGAWAGAEGWCEKIGARYSWGMQGGPRNKRPRRKEKVRACGPSKTVVWLAACLWRVRSPGVWVVRFWRLSGAWCCVRVAVLSQAVVALGPGVPVAERCWVCFFSLSACCCCCYYSNTDQVSSLTNQRTPKVIWPCSSGWRLSFFAQGRKEHGQPKDPHARSSRNPTNREVAASRETQTNPVVWIAASRVRRGGCRGTSVRPLRSLAGQRREGSEWARAASRSVVVVVAGNDVATPSKAAPSSPAHNPGFMEIMGKMHKANPDSHDQTPQPATRFGRDGTKCKTRESKDRQGDRRYHYPPSSSQRRPLFRAGLGWWWWWVPGWVGWLVVGVFRTRGCAVVGWARTRGADRDAQSGKCVVLRGTGTGNRGNLPGGSGEETQQGQGGATAGKRRAQLQPCS